MKRDVWEKLAEWIAAVGVGIAAGRIIMAIATFI
jgi:hypothetical protein